VVLPTDAATITRREGFRFVARKIITVTTEIRDERVLYLERLRARMPGEGMEKIAARGTCNHQTTATASQPGHRPVVGPIRRRKVLGGLIH